MAHRPGQPLVCAKHGQPDLVPLFGPRPGGTGGRCARLQPAVESGAAFAAGAALDGRNATNEGDELNFSRALFRRLPAEVLLDAICDVTGVPEKFPGVPLGQRAVQLWDSEQQSYFLKLFGRPMRTTACVCERSASAGISQALHFMNSNNLQAKLAHAEGSLPRWIAQPEGAGALVESAYLACFSRPPTAQERSSALAYLAARPGHFREAAEDLVWSLLNTLEFVFNH